MSKFDRVVWRVGWFLIFLVMFLDVVDGTPLYIVNVLGTGFLVFFLAGYELYRHGKMARECALLNQHDRSIGLIEACETYWVVVEVD